MAQTDTCGLELDHRKALIVKIWTVGETVDRFDAEAGCCWVGYLPAPPHQPATAAAGITAFAPERLLLLSFGCKSQNFQRPFPRLFVSAVELFHSTIALCDSMEIVAAAPTGGPKVLLSESATKTSSTFAGGSTLSTNFGINVGVRWRASSRIRRVDSGRKGGLSRRSL
jgi:hypothetical protein